MKILDKADTIFEESNISNISFGYSEATIVSDGVLVPCISERLDTTLSKTLGNGRENFIPALVLNVKKDKFEAHFCIYDYQLAHKGQKPEIPMRTFADTLSQGEVLYKIAQYDVVFSEAEKGYILWEAFRTTSNNWMQSVMETCKTMDKIGGWDKLKRNNLELVKNERRGK
ncbi:hypothetical protein [Caproiciproducens sp. CPB-2]|uniref:hypothetical protein n=1 Tax=Caproiciproducens sp. CPB-2 TaxID=3030017 RepID=UPI0023DB9277|nr:hypothetical protein [Caproiciproducens sp. CPB-2]MDF1496315.1 hypothetical protein [Caproiciproducens sp. CPB-2]